MKRALRSIAVPAVLGALFLVPFAEGAISTAQKKDGLNKFEQEVRRELVMLPWMSVFDHLQFQINGDEVILSGQVVRPTLRTDSERVVSRIEGVNKVTNNIEVLPLSPFDDRIRMATLRSIYGFGPLSRYGWGPVPPIRIIVKNGNVTLEGIVLNEADKNMATIRANVVPGVFSVGNNLQLESGS